MPIVFAISELALPDQDIDGADVSFIFTYAISLSTMETHDKETKIYFTAIRSIIRTFLKTRQSLADNDKLLKIGSFLTVGYDIKLKAASSTAGKAVPLRSAVCYHSKCLTGAA